MLYLKLQNSCSLRLENAVIKVAKLFSLESSCHYPPPSRGAPMRMSIFGWESACLALSLDSRAQQVVTIGFPEHSSPFCFFILKIHI